MRKAIQKKAKFDTTYLKTTKVGKCCFVPAVLGHAIDDDFIRPHHSGHIFEAYMIPNHVDVKIALELKKELIDNSLLDVSQSDLEANPFQR
ncbi:hypothetical protein QN277_024060 [Acacia crassicarpa]|nr:hypothetical protein QN277_024060 [Acacia crassicarpa]